MLSRQLTGKQIAIFIEHKFIPEEIEAYRLGFALLGADVKFFSRIYYGDYRPGHRDWRTPVFYSDVDPNDNEPWQSPQRISLSDDRDLTTIHLKDYAAVIMAANYTSVRLRMADLSDDASLADDASSIDARAYVQSAPVVRFFADAMLDKKIVKGALCHGLWILTPNPKLLKGRKVTCHTVVMADILNCGAEIQFQKDEAGRNTVAKIYVDDDLVTAFSKHEVMDFIESIANQILSINAENR